jgi:hypothetical protein
VIFKDEEKEMALALVFTTVSCALDLFLIHRHRYFIFPCCPEEILGYFTANNRGLSLSSQLFFDRLELYNRTEKPKQRRCKMIQGGEKMFLK